MAHHCRGLRQLLNAERVAVGAQDRLIDALTTNFRAAEIDPPSKALLEYAAKLTREPAQVGASDIELLRAQGFDDLAIHDACSVTAYFAFVNRIADGLGVELEADFDG